MIEKQDCIVLEIASTTHSLSWSIGLGIACNVKDVLAVYLSLVCTLNAVNDPPFKVSFPAGRLLTTWITGMEAHARA